MVCVYESQTIKKKQNQTIGFPGSWKFGFIPSATWPSCQRSVGGNIKLNTRKDGQGVKQKFNFQY